MVFPINLSFVNRILIPGLEIGFLLWLAYHLIPVTFLDAYDEGCRTC
jgi:hypothetical protein